MALILEGINPPLFVDSHARSLQITIAVETILVYKNGRQGRGQRPFFPSVAFDLSTKIMEHKRLLDTHVKPPKPRSATLRALLIP